MILFLLALSLGFNDMALKNLIENIPAANMGVRNDVDAFHTPEGALQLGRNVINIEGSLRPRMAHSDLSFVVLSVGTPVDNVDNLTKTFIGLVGTDIVMDAKAQRLDDLTTIYSSTWMGAQYAGVSPSFDDLYPGPEYWYQVVHNPTYLVIFAYDAIDNSVQTFSVQVDAPAGVTIEDYAVIGGQIWFNDENANGIFKETINSGGGAIDATQWILNKHYFSGYTMANGDGVLLVRGTAYLIVNGETSGAQAIAAPWITDGIIQNSTYHVNSNGNVVQAFVDPTETSIKIYEWSNQNGILTYSLVSIIEGDFTQEKIHSAGSLTSGSAVIWHNSSGSLYATTNDCLTFMSVIDLTGYDEVLGIYDGDIYLLKGTTDVWYIPLFAVSLSGEVVSMYQFDADLDDKTIVAANDEDLVRVTGGVIEVIGKIDGTLATGQPVSRLVRPVFRTFEKGTDTWLVWTDILHGVAGWKSDVSPQATVSASGVSGGRGLMVLANRLLKLGGEGDKAIEVDVSDFNDWENGWGTVEVALLGDTPGAITGGTEISALQGAIFKEDAILHAIAQVEFGGVAAPFRFEQIVAGINGPMSQHAILRTTDGYSMFLGRDGGVYVYDGARVHDLGRHVRQLVEGKLDFMYIEEAWGVFNPVKNLALFMYSTVGSDVLSGRLPRMDRGVIVDAASGSAWEVTIGDELEMVCGAHVIHEEELTIGEVGLTFGEGRRITLGDFDTEERMVMCGFADGRWAKQVWNTKEGNLHTDMGTALDVAWETGALPLGGLPHQFKTAQEGFHTFNKLDEELSIRLNRYDRDLIKQQGAVRSVGPGDFKTSHRETGRMFTVNGFGTVTRNFEYVMSSIAHRVRGQR